MKYRYRYNSVIVESSKPLDSAFFDEVIEPAGGEDVTEEVIPEEQEPAGGEDAPKPVRTARKKTSKKK